MVAPRAKSLRTTDEELKDCFQTFDKNGNGTVACSDLMHALSSLGERVPPEIIDELFREVDPNGEGQMLIDGKKHILLVIFYNSTGVSVKVKIGCYDITSHLMY